MKRTLTTLAVLGALLVGTPARAAKTDVVIMRNGDHITCEVKKLEHGKLSVKTDDMGDISIEWDKVRRLTSVQFFLVRTTSGFLHYGRFAESGRDSLLIVEGPTRLVELQMEIVVGLEAIKITFWNKLELSAALGYNYAKSTGVQGFTFNGSADYRGRVHRGGGSILADVSDTNEEIKRRYDMSGYYARVVSGRWFGLGSVGASRHDELGLDLRLRAGGGAGYRLVDSQTTSLSIAAGVYGNREWAADTSEAENSTEGLLGADYSVFIYDSPKTEITVKAAIMPSFTVDDRVRWELDASISRELFTDFYIDLSYYESRDTRPPSEDASTSDRSVTLKLRWSRK